MFVEQNSENSGIVRVQAILRGNHQRRLFKQLKARYNTVCEILSTEQTYVDSLEILVSCFLKPLRILGYISADNLALIFGNVEDILAKNTELLSLVRARVENWSTESIIGDIFTQNTSKLLLPHKAYVTGFTKANEILNSLKTGSGNNTNEINIFLSVVNTLPQCGQQLANLLIMPVQRIPRYVLLLSDLQKRTSPTHADNPHLVKAIEAATKLAVDINESNRKIGAVVAWLKVLANFSDPALPENANRGLFETLETKVTFGSAKIKAQKDKDVLFNVFLLTDFVVIAKKQHRQSLITGGKAVLKSVTNVKLGKECPIKLVANGIDFGSVVVEIENEEKRKIWFKLITDICSSSS